MVHCQPVTRLLGPRSSSAFDVSARCTRSNDTIPAQDCASGSLRRLSVCRFRTSATLPQTPPSAPQTWLRTCNVLFACCCVAYFTEFLHSRPRCEAIHMYRFSLSGSRSSITTVSNVFWFPCGSIRSLLCPQLGHAWGMSATSAMSYAPSHVLLLGQTCFLLTHRFLFPCTRENVLWSHLRVSIQNYICEECNNAMFMCVS